MARGVAGAMKRRRTLARVGMTLLILNEVRGVVMVGVLLSSGLHAGSAEGIVVRAVRAAAGVRRAASAATVLEPHAPVAKLATIAVGARASG